MLAFDETLHATVFFVAIEKIVRTAYPTKLKFSQDTQALPEVFMLTFLAHLILSAGLLLLMANLVRGVQVEGWGAAFIGALVLGFVNAVVRPLMVLLTLPLTVLTFGLFLLVINALMLCLVAAIVPGIRVQGFGPALLGSLVLTLLNLVVAFL